jgi:hypothetical protein
MLRTGSSAAIARTRSAAPAPLSIGVVIRDGARRATSAPARRTTGSSHRRRLKEEDVATLPPLPPKKKQWREMEAEA